MNIKKYIKQIVLAVITIIMLYFVFSNTDTETLIQYLKNADLKYLLLLAVCIVTAISFRGLCFKQLIYKAAKIPLAESALLCLSCCALNIVLPARAGDMFRAYYAGKKYGVNKVKIFGAVMFERILDMIAICSLLFAGIFFYKKNELAMNLCLTALIFIVLGIIFVVLTYKYIDISNICNKLITVVDKLPAGKHLLKKIIGFFDKLFTSFCSGFEILDSPKRLFFALITAFTIWFFECMNYVITLKILHCDAHFSLSIFITCFIVFAGLIPSTSIFLGPAQIAVIAAFALYGLDKENAIAASVVEQGLCTVICIIIAVCFLWKNNISYNSDTGFESKNDIDETIKNQ